MSAVNGERRLGRFTAEPREGFKFKLQTLLDVKEKMEEQKKVELGKANQKLALEQDKLNSFIQSKIGAIDQQRNLAFNKINVVMYGNYGNYISKLEKSIEEQRKKVAIEEKNVEKAKQNLIAVIKERKAYEKLKEKKLDEFKREVLSKEQKSADEIVTYKHSKKLEE